MKKQPYSPYNRASARFINNTLLWSGAFTLLLMIVLRIIDYSLTSDGTPNGIIGFELAKTMHNAQSMMGVWGNDGKIMATLSIGVDFLYIVSYSVFLSLSAFAIGKKLQGRIRLLSKPGYWLSWLMFFAGLFDVVENYSLIKILTGSHNQLWATTSYYFASTKFVIVLITLVYLITGLILMWVIKPAKNQPA